MKVIAGPTAWAGRITCSQCQAVLEVTREDLRVVNTAVLYAGETWDPRVYVTCCVCESDINCDDKVPSGIRSSLLAAARERRERGR